jgi:hypothetical protein
VDSGTRTWSLEREPWNQDIEPGACGDAPRRSSPHPARRSGGADHAPRAARSRSPRLHEAGDLFDELRGGACRQIPHIVHRSTLFGPPGQEFGCRHRRSHASAGRDFDRRNTDNTQS